MHMSFWNFLFSFALDCCVNYYFVVDQGVDHGSLPLGKPPPPNDVIFLVHHHITITGHDTDVDVKSMAMFYNVQTTY